MENSLPSLSRTLGGWGARCDYDKWWKLWDKRKKKKVLSFFLSLPECGALYLLSYQWCDVGGEEGWVEVDEREVTLFVLRYTNKFFYVPAAPVRVCFLLTPLSAHGEGSVRRELSTGWINFQSQLLSLLSSSSASAESASSYVRRRTE